MTRATVVIPARNAAAELPEQLDALARQAAEFNFEIVVADNGSTDATADVVATRSGADSRIRLISVERPGAGPARNEGARAARGDALLFCDADDVVAPGWVQAMVRALGSYDLVSGASEHEVLNPGASSYYHGRSHTGGLPVGQRFLPYAISANLAVRREAFTALDGFAEDLGTVGEDIDLSWRAQLAGYSLGFAPDAVVHYRHRETLTAALRQYVAYGRAEPVLYARFRHRGAVGRSLAVTVASYARLARRVPEMRRPGPRAEVLRQAAKLLGRVAGSVQARVIYL